MQQIYFFLDYVYGIALYSVQLFFGPRYYVMLKMRSKCISTEWFSDEWDVQVTDMVRRLIS